MFEAEVLGGDTPSICIRSTLLALDRDPACANPDVYVSAVSDDVVVGSRRPYTRRW